MRCPLGIITIASVVLLGCATCPGSAHAAFPGANGLIAFAATTDDGGDPTTQVYTVKPSGKGLRLVSDYGNAPAFSPAGRTLAYPDTEFDANGTAEIYLQSTRRPYREHLTIKHPLRQDDRGPGDFDPAWSPDGRLLAFTRCYRCDRQREDYVIFTMHRDATHVRPLARGQSPAWSIHNRIAFIANGDIFTVTPDGRDAQHITTGDASNLSPDWSPDGARIVFQRDTNFRVGADDYAYDDIYTVPAAGGPVTQLTVDHSSYAPAFSPDGASIVFSDGLGQLRLMSSSGGASRPIRIAGCAPNNGCHAFDPDWQPILRTATNT